MVISRFSPCTKEGGASSCLYSRSYLSSCTCLYLKYVHANFSENSTHDDAALAGDTDAGTAEATVEITPQADLWGPVVVNRRATCYFGAERGTNNTGEITGAIQALLWLLHVAEDGDAAILCDSCYTMDALEERMEIKTNVKLVDAGRVLLAQVRASRTVTFIHVKGHSTARVHYTC